VRACVDRVVELPNLNLARATVPMAAEMVVTLSVVIAIERNAAVIMSMIFSSPP